MTKPITPEPADAELVRRAQGGELEAFEALTNRYEQRVFSLAMRMLRQEQDAEDVTQQTFLSALVSGWFGFTSTTRFNLVRISVPPSGRLRSPTSWWTISLSRWFPRCIFSLSAAENSSPSVRPSAPRSAG